MYYKIVIGNSNKMSEIADRSIDLTVTSPPYLDLVPFKNSVSGELSTLGSGVNIQDKFKNFFDDLRKNFEEVYRVTKPEGKFVIEVEDYPVGSLFYDYPRELCLIGDFVRCVESVGFYLISRWYWKKYKSGAAVKKFLYVLYDSLNNADPRAISNIAYCFVFKKFNKVKENKKLDFTKEEWIEWQDGLWYIENPADELDAGQAIYPVELVKRFIKLYTNKDDTVLDPFLGTGTTMKAAYELGRNCVGYEIRPTMLEVIKKKVGVGQTSFYEDVKWEVISKDENI